MRKSLLLLLIVTFFSCEKNELNDLLPEVQVNETINMNLPEFTDLLTPSLSVETTGGINGLFIINRGSGNPPYKAYDRACPNNDCTSGLVFDGVFRLKCPCDDSEYNIVDSSPLTEGNSHFLREYKVIMLNEYTLNISNF